MNHAVLIRWAIAFIYITGTQVSTRTVMVDWLKALLPSWNIANLGTDWNDGRYSYTVIHIARFILRYL